MMNANTMNDALEIIDFKSFHSFFACCSKEVVGVDKNDNAHTLREEVGNALTLINRAQAEETIENISFYSRSVFNFVETSGSEHITRARNLYKQAARKLCFLSTICKKMSFDKNGFVLKKVDFENGTEVKELCLAFEWVADNAAELLS